MLGCDLVKQQLRSPTFSFSFPSIPIELSPYLDFIATNETVVSVSPFGETIAFNARSDSNVLTILI